MVEDKKGSWESRHPSWPFPEPRIDAAPQPPHTEAATPEDRAVYAQIAERYNRDTEAPAAQDEREAQRIQRIELRLLLWLESGTRIDVPDFVADVRAALAARAPQAAAEGQALTTCNCRWRGEELVQQCELHEAWHVAIHEWAERAKAAEALLAARTPQAAEPSPIPAVRDAARAADGFVRYYQDMMKKAQAVAEGRRIVEQQFAHFHDVMGTPADKRNDALAALRAAAPQPTEQAEVVPELWRHIKTGGIYEWLMSVVSEHDGETLVVYRSVEAGVRWARPSTEFYDGRFERLDRAAPAGEKR